MKEVKVCIAYFLEDSELRYEYTELIDGGHILNLINTDEKTNVVINIAATTHVVFSTYERHE